jgi:CRP/FNR family cyclic AMP-dependent transcriptional regulator
MVSTNAANPTQATQMTTLAEVDVFQDFPPEGLTRLASRGRPRRFHAGEPLLRQGEMGGALYVIVRGRVRSERSHPALSEPAAILELGPGESVGELGVLDATPSAVTVMALEETDTIELSALVLADVMLLYPVPAVGLLNSLSRSMHTLADLEARAQQLRSGPME